MSAIERVIIRISRGSIWILVSGIKQKGGYKDFSSTLPRQKAKTLQFPVGSASRVVLQGL